MKAVCIPLVHPESLPSLPESLLLSFQWTFITFSFVGFGWTYGEKVMVGVYQGVTLPLLLPISDIKREEMYKWRIMGPGECSRNISTTCCLLDVKFQIQPP